MSERSRGYYDYLNRIAAAVPSSVKLYLVGGAVRDMILGKPLHDYDFILEGLVRQIAKRIADEFDGKYYVMDEERDIVRVIIRDHDHFIHFDFAKIVGDIFEDDLRNRDFTINAIGVEFREKQAFLDPLGGISDLKEKRLRMCLTSSLRSDPVRALRGIRFSLEYGLKMDDELIREMEKIPAYLPNSSMERYRDELFKILSLGRGSSVVQLMERFAILDFLFPNDSMIPIDLLMGRMRTLEHLLSILTTDFKDNESSNLVSGFSVLKLGEFRNSLRKYFDVEKNSLRPRRSVLRFAVMAGLYKVDPKSEPIERILSFRGQRLVLSSDEVRNIKNVFPACEAIRKIIDSPFSVDALAVYRYFKQFPEVGVEGIFLFLTQRFDSTTEKSDPDAWFRAVDRVVPFLDAKFNREAQALNPKPFLTGKEIIETLALGEGPDVGRFKELVIEGQVTGAIKTRDEALSFLLELRPS